MLACSTTSRPAPVEAVPGGEGACAASASTRRSPPVGCRPSDCWGAGNTGCKLQKSTRADNAPRNETCNWRNGWQLLRRCQMLNSHRTQAKSACHVSKRRDPPHDRIQSKYRTARWTSRQDHTHTCPSGSSARPLCSSSGRFFSMDWQISMATRWRSSPPGSKLRRLVLASSRLHSRECWMICRLHK
jgi:hypothetical protein